ncbi:MAG: phosphotransferase [Actinomycetota bacterium]
MSAYVDRPITDRNRAEALARSAARAWRLPEPSPLRYGMNAVFTAGDEVLRVATPNGPASALHAVVGVLSAHGVPTVTPSREDLLVDGDMVVTAWRRLHETGEPADWSTVGAAVRRLHACRRVDLPAQFPLASPLDLPWWNFEQQLAASAPIDEAARRGIVSAIDQHEAWLDPATWSERGVPAVVCHGDIHPGNVTSTSNGPVIVDFDLMAHAPAAWDHAPLMTWTKRWGGAAGMYEDFADGYGASFRGDPAAEAFATLRLVAATLMRGVVARSDPQAQREFERRLRYWRNEPRAPMWQAV